MREINVFPTKARVVGNIIPKLSVDDFTTSDCVIIDDDTKLFEGINYPKFVFNAPATPVFLTVTANETNIYPSSSSKTPSQSNIAIELTDNEGNPCKNIDVFIYDLHYDSSSELYVKDRIGTVQTNNQGKATFAFNSNESGMHELTFRTAKQSNYDSTRETLSVNVIGGTELILKPNQVNVSETGTTELEATLLFNSNGVKKAIVGETVDLIYNNEVIGQGITNIEGKTYFTISKKDFTGIEPIPLNYSIEFIVKTNDGLTIPDASVTIGNTTKTTNASGKCSFTDLSSGTYNYSCSKEGYGSLNGSVTITNSDIIKNLIMSIEEPEPQQDFTIELVNVKTVNVPGQNAPIFVTPTSANLTINWGDGTSESLKTMYSRGEFMTHTYSKQGNYTITITGDTYDSLNFSVVNRDATCGKITVASCVTTLGSNFQYITATEVDIPSNVQVIEAWCFAYANIEKIIFKSKTPPTATAASAFTNLNTSCKIYVPQESLEDYKSATNYPNSNTYQYIGY